MNKTQLLQYIISELENVHQVACAAAKRAHDSATDKANKAENQYDTLGLEAAYLAHGQSQRVLDCIDDITAFKQLATSLPDSYTSVRLGALVMLLDEEDNERWLFLGPCAGGIKVTLENNEITLITASAPLGEALLGLELDDGVEIVMAGKQVYYSIAVIL